MNVSRQPRLAGSGWGFVPSTNSPGCVVPQVSAVPLGSGQQKDMPAQDATQDLCRDAGHSSLRLRSFYSWRFATAQLG